MTEPLQRATWLPVDACTLPTAERPLRVAEFDSLFAETLTAIEQPTGTAARFLLTGGAELAPRAQCLADRETGCCSFFTFTITEIEPTSVVMAVTVPDAHADVLSALVDRAREATSDSSASGTA